MITNAMSIFETRRDSNALERVKVITVKWKESIDVCIV